MEAKRNLFTLFFSQACIINLRHISSHKTAAVELEPHLVHDRSLLSLPLDHLLVVASLPHLIHLNLFSLACVINIRNISSHKMASVGIEPQLVHDTACCHYHYTTRSLLEDSRNLFTSFFSLACIINIRHIPSHKTASVGLEPHLVHVTSLLSLPLDYLLVVGRLPQLIHLIFFL